MQAQTSPRHTSNTLSWVAVGFGALLLVLLLLSFMADAGSPRTGATATEPDPRVAFLEFGLSSDTLWLASAADPTDRQRLFAVPHAAEYGIIPSISPDRGWFAYTALPETTTAPNPDSPAELWVAGLHEGATRSLLAHDVDLLVPPVWSPSGDAVIYRRSTEQGHRLLMSEVTGGEERAIASATKDTLFPISFTLEGDTLYFAALSETNGSRLMRVALTGDAPREIAKLSAGLTRDWSLSPDGTQLAYLEVAFGEAEMASRAFVLDLQNGTTTMISDSDMLAFGPVWGAAGELGLGSFDPSSGSTVLLLSHEESSTRVQGPETGFEVPLALDEDGGFVVQAFENGSLTTPGKASLVVVGPDGTRTTVGEGDMTLVGWTRP